MADDADRAEKLRQAEIDAAITIRKDEGGLRPVGHCHWCEEEVGPVQLFCDEHCERDYSRDRENRRAR